VNVNGKTREADTEPEQNRVSTTKNKSKYTIDRLLCRKSDPSLSARRQLPEERAVYTGMD